MRLTFALLAACAAAEEPEPYVWELPAAIEPPPEPEHNPTTQAKVELGARLFSDTRLSANGRYACSSCHQREAAFGDARTPSLGLYGEPLPRQAPSLANVGYLRAYTWANPLLTSLEGQALVPLLARRPAELDLADLTETVLAELSADVALHEAFSRAFPREGRLVTLTQVTDALAAYERTLLSVGSAYDRYLAGTPDALTDAAERGRELFFSSRLGCGECHRGRWLSDAAEPVEELASVFHNTGLYNLGTDGAYPRQSPGLIELTGRSEDHGKFRTPPLRNLTLTAPFMHDGSLPTLADVLDHYAAGGRSIAAGPYAGIGAANPNKDPRVGGFELSAAERGDVLSFLESLTDPAFVRADGASLAGTSASVEAP